MRAVSQFLILTKSFQLSTKALTTLGSNPQAFGFNVTVDTPVTMSMQGIYGVYQFRKFIEDFHDTSDYLADYLSEIHLNVDDADKQLCALTGWNMGQCAFVRTKLYGALVAANDVNRIDSLRKVFDGNVDWDQCLSVSDISDTALVPATQQNMPINDLAQRLLKTIKAKATTDCQPTVIRQINAPLLEQRATMLSVAVWELSKQFKDITTPRAVYEFLMIDVEMSGCALISIVKEAINAAQLYLQRCRLNLERNVIISTDDLPNVW